MAIKAPSNFSDMVNGHFKQKMASRIRTMGIKDCIFKKSNINCTKYYWVILNLEQSVDIVTHKYKSNTFKACYKFGNC